MHPLLFYFTTVLKFSMEDITPLPLLHSLFDTLLMELVIFDYPLNRTGHFHVSLVSAYFWLLMWMFPRSQKLLISFVEMKKLGIIVGILRNPADSHSSSKIFCKMLYFWLDWMWNLTTFITISKNHRIKRVLSKDPWFFFSNTKTNPYHVLTFTNIQTIKYT